MKPIVYAESIDGNPHDGIKFNAYNIYLHMSLENENGFDIAHMEQLPEHDGIYDVTVRLANGTEKDAVLYYWKANEEGFCGFPRGLVCNYDDVAARNDAQKSYNAKRFFL